MEGKIDESLNLSDSSSFIATIYVLVRSLSAARIDPTSIYYHLSSTGKSYFCGFEMQYLVRALKMLRQPFKFLHILQNDRKYPYLNRSILGYRP